MNGARLCAQLGVLESGIAWFTRKALALEDREGKSGPQLADRPRRSVLQLVAQFPVPSRSTLMRGDEQCEVGWAMAATRSFVPVAEWEDERHVLGLQGERVAIGFLTSCGWAVEAHRFRLGRHDVDLIIRRDTTVAFVEVKTRRSTTCGTGLESVTRRKQHDIARVAGLWALKYGRSDDVYRFDLLTVQSRRGAGPLVEHIEDAWRPDGCSGRY